MRSGEITFKLSGPDMKDVIDLIKQRDGLVGTVGNPICGDITVRMLNDVATQLGKALLTKSQGINVLLQGGFQPEEAETKGSQKVSQDRFTFFVNPGDTPFLLDSIIVYRSGKVGARKLYCSGGNHGKNCIVGKPSFLKELMNLSLCKCKFFVFHFFSFR